ncbi:uncharacterized protein EI90DRAFT_3051536 [Cantharellus anzutake]|uniref:uncharacterized protein n=1 Tax=Cantharellus anzutake TaxID=1750568 RepID=UPI001906F95B|nr:uncharacterized protein EI90DRAFT_3051536 [Cantharellus anzutake]KAF8334234.1 hypothetical protein EI90DRAFT_3051536 [Cantharellus anzutake]
MARTTYNKTGHQFASDDEDDQSGKAPNTHKTSSASWGASAKHNGNAKPISQPSNAESIVEQEGDDSDVAELNPQTSKPSSSIPSSSKKSAPLKLSNGMVSTSRKRKAAALASEHDQSGSFSPARKRTRTEAEWDNMVQQLKKERDQYLRDFEQLAKQRSTDAEAALEGYRKFHEEHDKHQKEHIQMLTQSMSRFTELSASGSSAAITLLTREATDARFQEYEVKLGAQRAEIAELREQLRGKDTMISNYKAEIETLKNDYQREIAMRQRDYDAEVSNSKHLIEERNIARSELAALTNGTTLKPRGGSAMREPERRTLLGPTKEQSTICLYEELTQLMVRSVATTKGEHGVQTEFKCYMKTTGASESLNFSLDIIPEPTEEDPNREMMRYTPHDLEKESEEFRESLDFLSGAFKCPKWQSPQFLHQIQLHMGLSFSNDAVETDEELESDEIEYLGPNEPT